MFCNTRISNTKKTKNRPLYSETQQQQQQQQQHVMAAAAAALAFGGDGLVERPHHHHHHHHHDAETLTVSEAAKSPLAVTPRTTPSTPRGGGY